MGAVARGAYSFMSPISHSPVTLPVAVVSMTDPTAAKTFTLPTRRVRTAR